MSVSEQETGSGYRSSKGKKSVIVDDRVELDEETSSDSAS
jgi:hypothetical protein